MALENFGDKIELTYGIYLVGFPIQQCMMAVMIRKQIHVDSILLTLVSFALSGIAAFILNVMVEKPAKE